METVDNIVGYIFLGVPFVIFTVMNYRILFLSLKKAERVPSPAPFIGGVAGAVLIGIITGFKPGWLMLIPLIIDPGSVPLLVWFVICMIWDPKR